MFVGRAVTLADARGRDHARIELLEIEVAGSMCAGCLRALAALSGVGAALVGPVHSGTVVLAAGVFVKSNTALEWTVSCSG